MVSVNVWLVVLRHHLLLASLLSYLLVVSYFPYVYFLVVSKHSLTDVTHPLHWKTVRASH